MTHKTRRDQPIQPMLAGMVDALKEAKEETRRREFEARTFKIPRDWAEVVDYWRDLIEQYNAAILAEDLETIEAVLDEHRDVLELHEELHDAGGFDDPRVADLLDAATAAPGGEVPLIGQRGEWLEVLDDGQMVICKVQGLGHWATRGSYPHLEFRAVEGSEHVWSETGFRSCFGMSLPDGCAADWSAVARHNVEMISRMIRADAKHRAARKRKPQSSEPNLLG